MKLVILSAVFLMLESCISVVEQEYDGPDYIVVDRLNNMFEAPVRVTVPDTLVFKTETEKEIFRDKLKQLQYSDKICQWSGNNGDNRSIYGDSAVDRMTTEMLTIVALLWQKLEQERFTLEVAVFLEVDLLDVENDLIPDVEHGGLGILWGKSFELLPIPSLKVKSSQYFINRFGMEVVGPGTNNYSYDMPLWAPYLVTHIFEYHQHAVLRGGSPEDCGPSGRINGLFGDVPYARRLIEVEGKTHQVLFTKLAGRTFSTYYFGGEKRPDGTVLFSVIALPAVEY